MAKKSHTDISEEANNYKAEAYFWTIFHADISTEVVATVSIGSVNATGFSFSIGGIRVILHGIFSLTAGIFSCGNVLGINLTGAHLSVGSLAENLGIIHPNLEAIKTKLSGVQSKTGVIDNKLDALSLEQ